MKCPRKTTCVRPFSASPPRFRNFSSRRVRTLCGPRHPLRPCCRRLLPRNLRPPRRGSPPPRRHRRPDFRQKHRCARTARFLSVSASTPRAISIMASNSRAGTSTTTRASPPATFRSSKKECSRRSSPPANPSPESTIPMGTAAAPRATNRWPASRRSSSTPPAPPTTSNSGASCSTRSSARTNLTASTLPK